MAATWFSISKDRIDVITGSPVIGSDMAVVSSSQHFFDVELQCVPGSSYLSASAGHHFWTSFVATCECASLRAVKHELCTRLLLLLSR
jgi:hypothetical protein